MRAWLCRGSFLVFSFLVFLGLQLLLPRAYAQTTLRAGLAKAGQIRVDGELGEWRGLQPTTVGDDPEGRAELRLAYDSSGLYVGANVHDDQLVRSAEPGARDDALVVTLAFADRGRFSASEIWLYAGVMGQSAATMKVARPGKSPRALREPARIVEGPSAQGYVIEAFIPWEQLDHGAGWPFVRGALRLRDVDRAGGPVRESSTAAGEASALPWLLLDGGPVAAVSAFLRQKDLASATPKLDWVGDVQGDASLARVLVIGGYVVLSTSSGRFTFADLPVTTSAGVLGAEMLDLNGDGRPELVLRLLQTTSLGPRELWQTWDLRGEQPRVAFTAQTREELAAGHAQAALDPRAGRASAAPPSAAEPPRAARPAASGAKAAGTAAALDPSGHDALIAAYRKARAVSSDTKARFFTQANVQGDARVETFVVIGSELVIAGEDFRAGPAFFYSSLPVRDASDVLRVFTGDVTGDGRREIFVRVRQRIDEVQREILLGYTFGGEELVPIVSVEVRRAWGDSSVGNLVSLVRQGRHFALQIAPGVGVGVGVDTYPFVSETFDDIGPLLLPWRDSLVRYRFDGRRLVRGPLD